MRVSSVGAYAACEVAAWRQAQADRVDAETWQALHSRALDRMNTIQELVEDAVADLLKKHHRPVTLKEALEASAPDASRQHHRTRKKARGAL